MDETVISINAANIVTIGFIGVLMFAIMRITVTWLGGNNA